MLITRFSDITTISKFQSLMKNIRGRLHFFILTSGHMDTCVFVKY